MTSSVRWTSLLGAAALVAAFAPVRAGAEGSPADLSYYSTSRGNWLKSAFLPLTTTSQGSGPLVARPSGASGAALPTIEWDRGDVSGGYRFMVVADGDQNVKTGSGDAVISWVAPSAGNWKLSLEAQNVGSHVKGGDGGGVRATIMRPADLVDNNEVFIVALPHSVEGPAVKEERSKVLKLEAGDEIRLRIGANQDSFGDKFQIVFRADLTNEIGLVVPSREYDSFIANPPATQLAKGAPMREGLFWLGTDGGWANSSSAEESIKFFKEFVPELALVMVALKPEEFQQPEFYRAWQIPTVIQNWGAGYEPFFKAMGAFEVNWDGRDLSELHVPGLVLDLSGTAHAISPPHPETRRAFLQIVQSSIRSGYSGFGICDMVWMWGLGNGAAGYNPKTIEAFRKDLLGQDEGIKVFIDGASRHFKLADYVKYYFGAMPGPAAFGYKDWQEYAPPAKANYPGNSAREFTSEFLLFDLLQHYEWLKQADFLGRSAEKEGGFFQCMPNPEDMSNGNDFLFLCGLESVLARSEEYFGGVEFMGGAYYRFPYLASTTKAPRQKGVVVEGGGGGNWWPYYDPEVAYSTAYELTLATNADHMEGDFWPNAKLPLDELVKDKQFRMRIQGLLSYGLGFTHAREDNARQLAPDFISVTSRRIFRPWVTTWMPWNWYLNIPGSPDLVLAAEGYAFQGIGEEGLQGLAAPQNVVLYSPSTGTEKGWKEFITRLKDGRIRVGIAVAPGSQSVVGSDFKIKPVSALDPKFALEEMRASLRGGLLTRPDGQTLSDTEYELRGRLFKPGTDEVVYSLDDDALVTKRKVGEQTLYTVLFDPSNPLNAQLTADVYRAILGELQIAPHWRTPTGTTARVYQNGELFIASVHGLALFDRKTPEAKKVEDRQFPYVTTDPLKVDLMVTSGAKYLWLGMPSGQQGELVAGSDGMLPLVLEGVSIQQFFVLPWSEANKERLKQIAMRKETFYKAMTVGGRLPPLR